MTLSFRDNDLGPIGISLYLIGIRDPCMIVYIGTTNTSEQRSIRVIALQPSNNNKGYWFMSLESGRRIHGYIWNELPIPEHVIRRVEELAEDEYAMDLDEDGCPIF